MALRTIDSKSYLLDFTIWERTQIVTLSVCLRRDVGLLIRPRFFVIRLFQFGIFPSKNLDLKSVYRRGVVKCKGYITPVRSTILFSIVKKKSIYIPTLWTD